MKGEDFFEDEEIIEFFDNEEDEYESVSDSEENEDFEDEIIELSEDESNETAGGRTAGTTKKYRGTRALSTTRDSITINVRGAMSGIDAVRRKKGKCWFKAHGNSLEVHRMSRI